MPTSIFLGGVGALWAPHVTQSLGYTPAEFQTMLVTLAAIIGLGLAGIAGDHLMARAGIDKHTRFGIWTGAIFGPYAASMGATAWGHPTLSHMLGVAVTVFMFGFGYHMHKITDHLETLAARFIGGS
jgi:hypothetical protein